MSGSIAAQPGGIGGLLIRDSGNVKQQLDTLLAQASTGHVADDYAGLGSGTGVALSVAPEIAAQQAWTNDINAATGTMQVTQTALTQISSIAATFAADANNLNGLNPSAVDSTAAAARQALQQVAGLLDSTDAGNYVFAGSDSGNAPVPDPGSILASGFYTQISATVGTLAGSGSASVIAATLAIAGSNAAGTSPFSAAMSQPAAALQATLPVAAVGPGQLVAVGIPASANAFIASTGGSTTGSYTRDILRALATLGSLSSAQVNDSGFAAVVQDAQTSLGGAITALNGDAGVLGNVQSTLAAEQTTQAAATTALQTQVSGAEDVDMAQTLSQLTQTQTRLQASYQLITGLAAHSLVKFIPPGGA